MSVLVAIPVRDRLDLTRPLVEGLERTDRCNVLILDNGSTDGTRRWALGEDSSRPSTRSCVDRGGATLHEMWNYAIEMALEIGSDIAILNNDLVLDGLDDWTGRLCAPFADGWYATCPNYDGRTDWRPIQPLSGICAGKYDGTGGLAGFAFALSRTFLEETGYRFPTEAKWWYGDTDLVRTLDHLGKPYGMVMGVAATHIGGGSQTAKSHDLAAQCLADKAWFDAKWGASCTTA